jgi:hypothetical protein
LNHMNFSIATLLSHFPDEKPVAPKLLEKKLGCEDDNSISQLGLVLDVLDRIGVLAKDKGKFRNAALAKDFASPSKTKKVPKIFMCAKATWATLGTAIGY